MGAVLPLVAREVELSAVAEVIDSAAHGQGHGILVTGEPGIGKTRLLLEARDLAAHHRLVTLRGRAVESGGAYRPLVEAFARPAAEFAHDPGLAGVRPTLARVLPGWPVEPTIFAPMADPNAVLASALVLLLQRMAPTGALLILDDLQWADPDTVSVLASVVDSMDDLSLALILASRGGAEIPPAVQDLGATPSFRVAQLQRLTPDDVASVLRASAMPELPADQVRQLVTVIDGLPLIMEEVVQQIAEGGPAAARPDLGRSTLASAVRLRLNGVSEDCRTVLNALSVIGDTDPAVLLAVTGLDPDRLGRALHAGLASTLLVSATNSLGVGWRHLLIRRAVRAELLPLEQQLIAGRAADQLAHDDSPTDGHLHHAARLYELAGHRQDAAQALIRAARAAVDHAALDLAERYLADAERLSGGLPHGAEEVLVERIETLSVAGRARDAYDSGVAALGGIEQAEPRRLLAATTRAAFAGGLIGEGRDLLATLENQSQPADADLMVLRAQAAFADHDPRAVALARDAARQARTEGRVDLECEAFVIAGSQATWTETEQAIDLFRRAIKLSQQHRLPRWEVRAKAALGVIDMMTDSDLTRLEQTRRLAADAGMVGAVAAMDMYIGLAEVVRRGFVAARPILLRADVQARKLRLRELRAHTYCHLIECHLVADQPLPGRTSSGAVLDVDAAVAQATALAERAHAKLWLKSAFGVRAWLRGDTATAIEMIERDVQDVRDQIKVAPWLGFWQLLQVAEGADPAETFQAIHLTGHHVNWAARALGLALGQLREGRPADEPLADADRLLRNAPYWGHVLRTVIAPAAFDAGHPAAEGWLREAEAFFAASGEWPLQRRVRQAIAGIGGKVPRTTASIPPHLARFGITARETEILRLINSGLSNAEIAEQLVISIRTVETHVSSLLQKTGTAGRDQLPEA